MRWPASAARPVLVNPAPAGNPARAVPRRVGWSKPGRAVPPKPAPRPPSAPAPPASRVGIDENGLGPRLGPLLVTGVAAELSPEGARYLEGLGGLSSLPRVDDSKKVASFKNPDLAEAWARALVPEARSPDELVAALSLASPEELRAPCPSHVAAQCWQPRGAFRAPAALVAEVAADRDGFARRGVTLGRPRSVIVCPARLHAERALGRSLFDIDLHAMERLLLAFHEASPGGAIDAVCGKVGGLDRYLPRLGPLAGRLAAIEEEGRARSAYRFAGLGRVAFVRDADGSDVLVALASLVGKYAREVLMGHVADFYRHDDPALPRPSGYRDPVTDRFVLATAARREALGVPDRCFLRP